MPTVSKPNRDRLTIAEAKRLILEVLPRERTISVYSDKDDVITTVFNEHGCIQATFIDQDLPSVCAQLGIAPRHKYRPSMADYDGEASSDDLYTLAHDEFEKVAALFDVAVLVQELPSAQQDRDSLGRQIFDLPTVPTEVPTWLRTLPPTENVLLRKMVPVNGEADCTAALALEFLTERMARQKTGVFTFAEVVAVLRARKGESYNYWRDTLTGYWQGNRLRIGDPVTEAKLIPDRHLPKAESWLTLTQLDECFVAEGKRYTFSDVLRQYAPGYFEKPTAEATPDPAPVQAPTVAATKAAIDYTLLAAPEALVSAFGTFTGMALDWFDPARLKDTLKLKAARKVAGTGGRNSSPPLFCPFEVMAWLTDSKRKKGRPLSESKGWSLLASHFPQTHAKHSAGDPN